MRFLSGKWRYGLWILLASFSLIFTLFHQQYLFENPFSTQRTFVAPSFVTASDRGTALVIDNSKTRISVLNSDHRITATIQGGVQSDRGFYYAVYAVTDGKKIYIADTRYTGTGTKIAAERIMQYSMSGNFEKVLYRVDYSEDNMPLQTGNISSLQLSEKGLTFLQKEGDKLSLYQITDGQATLVRSLPTTAYIHHTLYNAAKDTISFTTKDGLLYSESSGSFAATMNWSGSQGDHIFWELAADSSGQVYCTDIGSGHIIKLSDQSAVIDVGSLTGEGAFVYRLSCQGTTLAFTDNQNIFLASTDGTVSYQADSAGFVPAHFVLCILTWLCVLILGMTALFLVGKLLVLLFKENAGVTRLAFLLGLVVILSTAFVSANILSQTLSRSSEKDLYVLTQTITPLSENSGTTIGDQLKSITSLQDYGSPTYKSIRSYLDSYCNAAYANGSNMYYILYKYSGDLLYGVADYENTIGTIYPYQAFSGSDYETVAQSGQIVTVAGKADSYGNWSYAIAPIYDSSGNTVGLLEIGSDLFSEQLQNNALLQKIILSTAVLILVFLLFLTEAASFAQYIRNRQKQIPGGELEFIRSLAFLTFLSNSFAAAFTPQLSERLYSSSGFNLLPATLGAAFPMSAQLFFVALTALCGGFLIDRFGVRRVLTGGIIIQFSGLLATAFAVPFSSYAILLAGHILSGSGMGAAVVSINAIPTFSDSEEERNTLFSDLNVGILSGVVIGSAVGSYLAESAGYFITYLVSAFVVLPGLFITYHLGSTLNIGKPVLSPKNEETPGTQIAPLGFLSDLSVLSFLLFLMFPFLVIMYFKDYFFPLFASSAGFTDSQIGTILLFGGALSIYITPSLSMFLLKKLRAKGTIILSSALFISILFLFSIFPNIVTAIVSVFVICLAGSLGMSGQGIYYSSLPITAKFGSGKAMGMFSLFDNLGQTAGPLLFGFLLLLGFGMASLTLAISALALLVIFLLINFKKGTSKS
jgi:predicted MFS family arabinose efflux permease